MSTITAPLASTFKAVSTVQSLSARFAPVIAQAPDTDTNIGHIDYIGQMEIERNIDLDSGSETKYDVQPDTRFLVNYIEQNIGSAYPELNVKGHPYVSPASLAGYDLLVFYAHLLGCDIHHRKGMSHWATTFSNDAKKKELLNELLYSHVSRHMVEFLLSLAPVFDPRRSQHLYVPTLAGYSHAHDYGRTIPPAAFFTTHHHLATTSSRKEPNAYQANIYFTNLVTFNKNTYRVANYFGTQVNDQRHENWLNLDFESFINPVVGRILVQKPTFAKIPYTAPTYHSQTSFNAYEYFLMASDINIDTTLSVVRALSRFHSSVDPKSPTLGSILASLSGALLPMHTIEPPTLPTWSAYETKTKAALDKDGDYTGTLHEDTNWATLHHRFLADPTTHAGTIPDLKDDTNLVKSLYLVVKSKFNKDKNPVKYVTFDTSEHVTPYVLYFQPYDVSPSAAALVILAGLKIEIAEIAGFTIPTESPQSSLDDNNSQHLQSAIRLNRIFPVFNSVAPSNDYLRIWKTQQVDRTNQGMMVALRTIKKNLIPTVGNDLVNDKQTVPQMDDSGVIDDIRHGTNVFAGNNGIPTQKFPHFYLWSSYRIVHKRTKPDTSDISMIGSFRPIYGLNVTLSRSKNPALIIPH